MAANASDVDVLAPTNEASVAGEPRSPAVAAAAVLPAPPFLSASQRDAANEIRRTLAARHVFAAVTGAPGLGKTTVLSAAVAAAAGSSRVSWVGRPDRISVEQAEQLIATQAAAWRGGHAVLVVDDADRASPSLLRGLTRIAEASRLNPGAAQVILAGRPELWDRLEADEFTPLRDRIAVRPVLRPMTDEDAHGLIRHLLNEPRKIFGQALAEDAEREVLRLADGRPERIGALVRSTLMLSDLQVRAQLSVDMVHATADMLDGRQPPVSKRRAKLLRPALAAGLAVALTGGLAMAAHDGGLERVLSAVHDVAERPAAVWVREASNAPATAAVTAESAPAGQPEPALRPAEAGPPAAAADAQETVRAQPAPMPALAVPPAAQDDAGRLAAEGQLPPQLMPPAPALPAPMPPEPMPARTDTTEPAPVNAAPAEASQVDAALPETPDALASAAPASDDRSPAAEGVPSQAVSEPIPMIEASAPPQDPPAERADASAQPAPAREAAAAPEPAPASQATISMPQPPSVSKPAAASEAGATSSAASNTGQIPDTSKKSLATGLVAALLRRGDEGLAHGDVSAARQFYGRIGPAGNALGARGMARTYDPAVLGRGNPAADPKAAAAWYEKAARLDARPGEHESSVQHEANAQRPLEAGR